MSSEPIDGDDYSWVLMFIPGFFLLLLVAAFLEAAEAIDE